MKSFRIDASSSSVLLGAVLSFVHIDAGEYFYGESYRNRLGVSAFCGVHEWPIEETVEDS